MIQNSLLFIPLFEQGLLYRGEWR